MAAFPQSSRKALTWLLVSLALVQLPFILTMPFHIDDGVFLHIAENVGRQPLMPLGQPIIWEGRVWADMMSHSHPPLACYLMYAGLRLGGPNPEALVHLLMLPFFLLLGWALYEFFRFFRLPPALGTLLAVFSPVVFVSSHTLMMDVPTLSLGLSGVVLAFRGVRDDRVGPILAGGGFMALGLLTAYSAIFYVLPPMFYALVRRQWKHLFWIALVPAAALAGWFLMVYAVTGRFVPADVVRLLAQFRLRPRADWVGRIVYNLAMAGGTILFPAALLAWRWPRLRGKLYALGMMAAGLALALIRPGEGFWRQAAIAALAVAGAILLGEAVAAAIRRGREPEDPLRAAWWAVAGWIAAFCLVTVLAYPHGAARYQIWLVPPLLVAFLGSWGPQFPGSNQNEPILGKFPLFLRWGFLTSLVAGQVVLASACALADLEMARAYRAAVAGVLRQYPAAGNALWVAADWEVRYYAVAGGGRTILRYDRRPRPGDLLLKTARTCPTWETRYERPDFGQRLGAVEARTRLPVRILDPVARAGFYSDYWGFAPVWWMSPDEPVDVLEVYRVTRSLPPDPALEASENAGMFRLDPSVPLPR
jgi:hypothetical protein